MTVPGDVLASILTVLPDAAVVVDGAGLIVSANDQAGVLFGWDPAALPGLPVEVLLPERLRSTHVLDRSAYTEAPSMRPMGSGRELRALRADGLEVDVEISLAPVDLEGGTVVLAAVRDITERNVAREAVRVAEDRERIARELHDVVIQRLFGTGMLLQGIQDRVGEEAVRSRIGEAIDELDRTIRELRNAIFALATPADRRVGLRQRVLDLAAGTAGTITPAVRFDGPLDTVVPDAVGRELLAVAGEALSNARRHAAATSISVDVVLRAGTLTLVVEDDGVGFTEPARSSGLTNMAVRAEQLGGTSHLRSAPGAGTTLTWSVPL